eukprot:3506776-Prymnesium_polylepis.2
MGFTRGHTSRSHEDTHGTRMRVHTRVHTRLASRVRVRACSVPTSTPNILRLRSRPESSRRMRGRSGTAGRAAAPPRARPPLPPP